MPALNIQVRCAEAQASGIIKICRDTFILGDSVPFIIYTFVVPLSYQLQRSLGIYFPHLDISIKRDGIGFWM